MPRALDNGVDKGGLPRFLYLYEPGRLTYESDHRPLVAYVDDDARLCERGYVFRQMAK